MGAGRSRYKILSIISNKQLSEAFGADGKDLLSDSDNLSLLDEEYAELLLEMGMSSLSDVLDYQGFSGLPVQINEKEYGDLIERGGIELARGVSAPNDSAYNYYMNDFLNGNFYVEGGEAYFGKGMYAFGGESLNQASRYGNVTNMVLAPNAKVYTVDLGEHYGFKNKKVLDTFYTLQDTIDMSQAVTHFKVPKYNRNNRLQDYVEIAGGNDYFMKQKGIKTAPENPYSMYTEMGKYKAYSDKAKVQNIKYAREYLTKEAPIPKSDVNLIYQHLTKHKPSNDILAAKGYDAIKFTSRYVNENSKNGNNEIWVVLNRTKIAVQKGE